MVAKTLSFVSGRFDVHLGRFPGIPSLPVRGFDRWLNLKGREPADKATTRKIEDPAYMQPSIPIKMLGMWSLDDPPFAPCRFS